MAQLPPVALSAHLCHVEGGRGRAKDGSGGIKAARCKEERVRTMVHSAVVFGCSCP